MIGVKEGVNILELLRECGFTAYEIRRQGIIGERRLQALRKGELPTMRELDFICWATARKTGDIIEYTDTGTPWTEKEG